VWACGVSVQAALCNASFYPLHDRKNPPSMLLNVYRASDDSWFLLVLEQSRWPALAKGIGRPDLLTDARFNDAAKQAANSAQLTAILDEAFGAQPMAHWHEVFEQAGITFGRVQTPADVIKDPQLRENDIVVPLEGAGGDLTSTISSPIRVAGVTKVPARRHRHRHPGRPRVLDEHGCAQPRGWLDRARRPRREEPYDHRSGGRHVHAEAVPSRQGQRQALLVRSRGDARDASESRRLERRDSRGHEPGRSSTGAGGDEMVCRDHARSGARPHVLDAERSGQR